MRNHLSMAAVLLCAALAGCGGDDDGTSAADAAPSGGPDAAVADAAPGTPDAEVPDAEPAEFTLTSTAIHGTDLLADKYTCAGDNVSPPLAWTAGPAGTKSYAVLFVDVSGQNPFNHSVIWDIPPSVLALPEHVENVAMPSVPAGSKQGTGYDGQTLGYLGPCPPSVHTYQFVLYALDVATLPGVSAGANRNSLPTVLEQHKLTKTTLQTMSD